MLMCLCICRPQCCTCLHCSMLSRCVRLCFFSLFTATFLVDTYLSFYLTLLFCVCESNVVGLVVFYYSLKWLTGRKSYHYYSIVVASGDSGRNYPSSSYATNFSLLENFLFCSMDLLMDLLKICFQKYATCILVFWEIWGQIWNAKTLEFATVCWKTATSCLPLLNLFKHHYDKMWQSW